MAGITKFGPEIIMSFFILHNLYIIKIYVYQGRNHRKMLAATSAMVGRIFPLLVGIGLRFLKFRCDSSRAGRPCGYIPDINKKH